jgi:hypothetical protein
MSMPEFFDTNIERLVYRRVVGLDLGKAVDFTALTVLDWIEGPSPVYTCAALRRWPLGASYTDISLWLARFFLAQPAETPRPDPVLVVDETGVGSAVCEMIRSAMIRANVQGGFVGVTITAGSAASCVGPGRWRVAKKQLASVLVTLFQSRRLRIAPVPERETLIKEAQSFSVRITPAGNESFESWRDSEHDDLVLSLGLACWAAEWVQLPPWPRRESY